MSEITGAVDIEAFARLSAKNGISQRQTAETLGINREKFRDICALFQPLIEWPGRNQSLGYKLAAEAKRGVVIPSAVAAMHSGLRRKAALTHLTIDGRTGTPEYLAQFYPVSARTIRRRMKTGKSIEEAVKV